MCHFKMRLIFRLRQRNIYFLKKVLEPVVDFFGSILISYIHSNLELILILQAKSPRTIRERSSRSGLTYTYTVAGVQKFRQTPKIYQPRGLQDDYTFISKHLMWPIVLTKNCVWSPFKALCT